jgi:hypothetical protein
MEEIKQTFSDHVAEVRQKEQRSEITHLGSIRPKKGHTLFEINLKTKEIVPATFEEKEYRLDGKNSNRRTVVVKDDCTYISALNEKNAIRKLLKSVNNAKK